MDVKERWTNRKPTTQPTNQQLASSTKPNQIRKKKRVPGPPPVPLYSPPSPHPPLGLSAKVKPCLGKSHLQKMFRWQNTATWLLEHPSTSWDLHPPLGPPAFSHQEECDWKEKADGAFRRARGGKSTDFGTANLHPILRKTANPPEAQLRKRTNLWKQCSVGKADRQPTSSVNGVKTKQKKKHFLDPSRGLRQKPCQNLKKPIILYPSIHGDGSKIPGT